MNRFTRVIFATSLSRELTWALLIKMAALGLLGWVFFGDPAPPSTADAVGTHLLQNLSQSPPSVPMPDQGAP